MENKKYCENCKKPIRNKFSDVCWKCAREEDAHHERSKKDLVWKWAIYNKMKKN